MAPICLDLLYICWFNSDALSRRSAYNPQKKTNKQVVAMDQAGIELTTFRQRQHRQLPARSLFFSYHNFSLWIYSRKYLAAIHTY